MGKKKTFGEVLQFLSDMAPRMTEYLGEEWGEHVMEMHVVIEEMMKENDLKRKDTF